ncbi:hypothetical protein PGT21_001032 [Puccinia graminis f. sp. tritici]|uniref:Uncharacterized protein n=1 Tax=Puccinia graminis f. sp. tritici TaxID=56615 RepID=A0A5B0QRF2_PUCGR|nr:hypothetical protein PGT21_001032 [Puccinia graminis f. sp. tritici]
MADDSAKTPTSTQTAKTSTVKIRIGLHLLSKDFVCKTPPPQRSRPGFKLSRLGASRDIVLRSGRC